MITKPPTGKEARKMDTNTAKYYFQRLRELNDEISDLTRYLCDKVDKLEDATQISNKVWDEMELYLNTESKRSFVERISGVIYDLDRNNLELVELCSNLEEVLKGSPFESYMMNITKSLHRTNYLSALIRDVIDEEESER